MALQVGAQVNGTVTLSPVEENDLYSQLSRLRDAVIAGKHPQFRLPPAAIEQLKANLAAINTSGVAAQEPTTGNLIDDLEFNFNAVSTNNAQQAPTRNKSNIPSLPGLQTPKTSSVPATLRHTSSGGLDPIFLQKSDVVVRAEGQFKRQRIERELQTQLEQRKPGVDKISGTAQDPSPLDVDAILLSSSARESHFSGLKLAQPTSPASSFDTNDYYSSQVESEWSSPASASKDSDRAAGAVSADLERLGEQSASSSFTKSNGKQPAFPRDPQDRPAQFNYAQFGNSYAGDDDEDDEYSPPDATAFDSFHEDNTIGPVQGTPPDEVDNSDYEPGEITQESHNPAPYYQTQQTAQTSPQVPVIRNHLTHIAAPQPSRVSPLAVAKRPSIELELVNGRPEVVQKHHQPQHGLHSRASTGSPVNGISATNNKKKRREKKRKREPEPSGRGKRKRDKQNTVQMPSSPAHKEPRIKDEPISPPSFAKIPDIQPQMQRSQYQNKPTEIDLVSPRYAPPQVLYANEPPRSALRYEYSAPASPAVVGVASPAVPRPVQRDNQDLRRVASLHNAQRPPTPSDRVYSPAQHHDVSLSYADQRFHAAQATVEPKPPRYQERPPPQNVHYVRAERSQSPPRTQQYQDQYVRAQSPAIMPPPAAPPRKIVVDQYGNQYYAAEPVPAFTPVGRNSLAPVDRRAPVEQGYDRAPSRMAAAYNQPVSNVQYEQLDVRMAPPTVPKRPAESQSIQHVENNGYRVRGYGSQPVEQIRYIDAPTSPTYQQNPRYEQMPPPSMPNWETTSPIYTPTRSYSVRPEELALQPVAYAPRQASAAPVQYVRQEAPPAPTRAMSVALGFEQTPAEYNRAYSQAPQNVQYVDQYGRPVYPNDARQLPRYQ